MRRFLQQLAVSHHLKYEGRLVFLYTRKSLLQN